jgi:hypothetical protein
VAHLIHVDESMVVADDVLDDRSFHAVVDQVARGRFRSVHADAWDRSWPPRDGAPLRGPSVLVDPNGTRPGPALRHPTGSIVDALIDEIFEIAAQRPAVVGRRGPEWDALYLAPWLYPVGTALSAHFDSGPYCGAFTFFAHHHWLAGWGGELVVEPSGAPLVAEEAQPADGWLSDDPTELDTVGSGIALAISPRPNRLVLLGPDRRHRIARVDANAGAHVRASIAGFFLRS